MKITILLLTVAGVLLLNQKDVQAGFKKAKVTTFPFGVSLEFDGEPTTILTHGPFTLSATCERNQPTGQDTISLIVTSSKDDWHITGDQPEDVHAAGDVLTLLNGNEPTNGDGYGGPAPIGLGQTAGRSVRASSGEVVTVLADSVAFGFGETCTVTG